MQKYLRHVLIIGIFNTLFTFAHAPFSWAAGSTLVPTQAILLDKPIFGNNRLMLVADALHVLDFALHDQFKAAADAGFSREAIDTVIRAVLQTPIGASLDDLLLGHSHLRNPANQVELLASIFLKNWSLCRKLSVLDTKSLAILTSTYALLSIQLVELAKDSPDVASENYERFFGDLLLTDHDRAIPDKIFLRLSTPGWGIEVFFGNEDRRTALLDFVKGLRLQDIHDEVHVAQEFASLRMAATMLSGATGIGASETVHLGLMHYFYRRARAQFQGCNSLLERKNK